MSLVAGNCSEMDERDQEGIDRFNDETFGSGAVESDWESAHLSALRRLPGGEDLAHVLQEDIERDGHGNEHSKPLTPVQGGPAFAVLNNGRTSQERDIPTEAFVEKLNISDLEELWSNSPKQSSMLSDPVWSSPELPPQLRMPQEHTSPVPPPKLISVEELEREMMRESTSPSPGHSPSPPVTVPSSHSHQPPLPPPPSHQQQPPSQHALPVHPLIPFPPSTVAGNHMRPLYPPGLPIPMVNRHMAPPHPMGPQQHMIGRSILRPALPFPMPPRLPPNVPLLGPPRMFPPYGMFPRPAHMPPHLAHRMPLSHHSPHRGPHPMHPQHPLHPHHYQQQQQQQQQPMRPHHPPPSKLSEMLAELQPDGSGFMNQKEKEWVVKVQLMQLQSGDPEVDDYYYQNFVQRRAAKASKGEGVVVASDKPLPLSLPPAVSKEERRSRSKAVEFEGTLGKVSVSSVSAPRQTINISSPADITGSKGGGVTNGKKDGVSRRKQILIAVEEIYDLVMELESLEHQTITLDKAEAEAALARKKKICSRIFALTRVKASFSDSPATREKEVFFQSLMQLRKGKRSFQRFLPFLSDEHAKALLFALCKNMPSIVKRDLADQVLVDCVPAVIAVLNSLKMEDINLFLSLLRPLSGKLQENKLFQAMIVTLVKRGIEISTSSELPDKVLSGWLAETKQVYSMVSASLSALPNNVLVNLLESLPHINR